MDLLTDPRHPHYNPLAPMPKLPRPKGCDGIGLVLQGGGALGAYQAGVYQALHEAGLEPDWVAGMSIGAINSAIIAGNEPAQRVASWRNSGSISRRATPTPSGPRVITPACCATWSRP